MMKESFDNLDQNGDGVVTQTELHQIYERMGIQRSEEQLNEIFQKMDENGKSMVHPPPLLLLLVAFLIP